MIKEQKCKNDRVLDVIGTDAKLQFYDKSVSYVFS